MKITGYVAWALLGMAGYSATPIFVKLATRSHQLAPMHVLAIAVSTVTAIVWLIVLAGGSIPVAASNGVAIRPVAWALCAGLALAIAVTSLFRALASGPASVVIPIYGMFILGASALGILFLGEALTARKAVGFACAIAGVLLVAR